MTIDTQRVDFEDFGDEIIFINIKSGSYMTVKGKGMEVVRLFQQNVKLDEVNSLLDNHYDAEEASSIRNILNTFVQEGVFTEAGDSQALAAFTPDGSLTRTQFVRHDDMQDIIKLDPIHDVSDLGWPNQKKDEQ